MPTVKGFVDHIVFRDEETAYKVLTLNADGIMHTLVGNMSGIRDGDFIECDVTPTTSAVYGDRLKVTGYRLLEIETAGQMERYLASGAVKGIGAHYAAKIVREFGDDTFRVMEEEPEKLTRIKGIGMKKACDIALSMQEQKTLRAPLMFLQNYGISGALSMKLMKKYGDNIYAVIQQDPYRLAEEVEGIGFKRADEIALKAGIEITGEQRVRSGILFTLRDAAQEGDCYMTGAALKQKLAELLGIETGTGEGADGGIPEEVLANELAVLRMSRQIFITSPDDREEDSFSDHARVYEARLYRAERETACILNSLEQASGENGQTSENEAEIDGEIDAVEKTFGLQLDDLQKKAVRGSLTNGVVLITGGPGTGKTTIIRAILRLFQKRQMQTCLCAPTGRAAKRMTELCGQESKTIHRLLEVSAVQEGTAYSGTTFMRNEDNPLECDAVIADEMSMVDIRLFQALLRAMLPGMRLIIVGDAGQLPSVGPGQVLRDLIDSNCFTTVTLNKIFRQEEASDIVVNAHRIHQGEPVVFDNKNSKDFFLMARPDVRTVRETLVGLVMRQLPGYLHLQSSQIQVLTPMRKGELGVSGLNALLQQHINPRDRRKKEYSCGEKVLREGDKVMQVKNNYRLEWRVYGENHIPVEEGKGVFNGDMGKVLQINPQEHTLEVLYDEGRTVTYTNQEAEELELAYAVTIHKSQGSEYPAVVIPLLGGPRPLMNRNLLYTGVTRARNLVVIVGSQEVVGEMIANETQIRRCTGLCEKIRQETGYTPVNTVFAGDEP